MTELQTVIGIKDWAENDRPRERFDPLSPQPSERRFYPELGRLKDHGTAC